MTTVNLNSLKGLRHYNGQGSAEGSDLYTAVTNMLADAATHRDLITLLSKNNYGGPLTTYRNSRAKSQQKQEVAEAIMSATKLAKKLAPKVLNDAKTQLVERIIAATQSVTDEQAEQIARAWWDGPVAADVDFMVHRTMIQLNHARNGEVIVIDYDSGLNKIIEAGEAVNAGRGDELSVLTLVHNVRDLGILVKK